MKTRIILLFLSLLIFPFLIYSQDVQAEEKVEAKVIETLEVPNRIPWHLLFSPDGQLLFCEAHLGSYNTSTGRVRISMDQNNFILDFKKRKKIADLGEMPILGFSKQNKVLIKKNGIKIWDYKRKRQGRTITNIDGDVYCSTDGKYAATIIGGEKVLLTDLESKQKVDEYPIPPKGEAQVKFIFDGTGTFLRLSFHDKTLNIMDVLKNQEVASLTCDVEKMKYVAISPDGKYLATSDGGPIYLWNIPEKTQVSKIEMGIGGFNSLNFSRDGSVLGACTAGTQVLLWDMTGKNEVFFSLGEHKGPVVGICFSPTENIFVTSSFDGTLKIWRY